LIRIVTATYENDKCDVLMEAKVVVGCVIDHVEEQKRRPATKEDSDDDAYCSGKLIFTVHF